MMNRSYKAEITDLGETIFVNQDVWGFNISMNKLCRVEIMNRLCYLIQNVSFMLLPKHVLANECVQVDIHVLKKYVDILLATRANYLPWFNYIRVWECLQIHYLSECTLCIRWILKSVEIFLKGIEFASSAIHDLPYYSVSSTSDLLHHFKPLRYVCLDFIVLAHYI